MMLESLGVVDDGPYERSALLPIIHHYDVLIVRLGHMINREIMQAAPRLKTIVTATTGLNHIDINEAETRGITVLSLQGEREFLNDIYATAEHTWALLLALCRSLPHAYHDVLVKNWDRDKFRGIELHGKTLGILGLGRIGTKVVNYGNAFGMNVIGYNKSSVEVPEGVRLVSLNKLLQESDIVSIHVNYSSDTHGMFGECEIFSMKKGALLVNTSRGEILDEKALLDGLLTGHLGGAALDVLCGENNGWQNGDPLIAYARSHSNLLITPHIGGCTVESMGKTELFMAHKLINHYSLAK